MLSTLVALTSLALAAPAAPPPSQTDTAQASDAPPPGSAADQALWRAGREINERVWTERARGTRLQAQAIGLPPLLRDAAKQGKLDPARAQALEHELSERWNALSLALVDQWPVDPTRVCGYPILLFEGTLRANESPQKAAQIAETRAALEECIRKAKLAVDALQRAADDFSKTSLACAQAVTPTSGAAAAVAPASAR